MRCAVLWNDDNPTWIERTDVWQRALQRPDDPEWETFVTPHGELPPHPEAFDAYILTGSAYSVNDPEHRWLPAVHAFIREAVAAERPVFGSCFGHQLLATTFGGRVGPNPSGRFVVGVEEVHALPDGGPLGSYRILQSHGECVRVLPPGARWHATSRTAEFECFSIGEHVLAVQGHPELSVPEVRDRIVATREADGRLLPDEARRARATLATGHDGPQLLATISGFLRSRAHE